MNWFVAHIIMYVKFKDGKQNKFPIWENIVLVSAKTEQDAYKKSIKKGKDYEGDSDGTFFWENRAAVWVFAGIRKIIECEDYENRPNDGCEITYSEMELLNEEDLQKLIDGKSVTINYID